MKLCRKTAFALLFFLSLPCLAAAQDTAPGHAYRDIQQRKQIRIGISKNYPPLNFNAGEKGVEILMARRLGEFLGVETVLVPLNVNEYTAAITDRKVDIVIAGFSRSLQRARYIWFSEPYLSVTPGVLADNRSIPQTSYGEKFEETPIKSLWDLKRLTGMTLAVKKESIYEQIIRTDFPQFRMVLVTSNEEGLAMLAEGRVNGFIHDSLYLEYLYDASAKLRNSYALLKGGHRIERLCVGLPFGDPVLKNQVDAFILEIIRLGYIDQWLREFMTRK